MPSISGVGNISPVSTTTILPSYSTTVMFLPISPRPPSGRTRSFAAIGLGDHRYADGIQRLANRRALRLIDWDHRQAQGSGRDQAGDLERRLERHRVGGHGQGLIQGLQANVDRARAIQISALRSVPHLTHLIADQLRGDEDASGQTELEGAQED